jgi:micrococcal nuclease
MGFYSYSAVRRDILAILAVIFLAACPLWSNQALASPPLREARVLKVHDGDTVTILMDGKEYRTRLIGIDAPEMGQRPWGNRAKDHLISIMKHNDWAVYVETGIVQFDKYNRLLAYLWIKEKDCINERMLLDGYAVLFTIQPNSRHVDRFKKAQRIAREQRRGIWGPDGLKETPLDYKKKHPR